MIKRILLYTILLCAIALNASAAAPVKTIEADRKAASAFIIFTDRATYQACREEIEAYRTTLQLEGLGAYIIYSDWQKPEDVKAEINRIARKKQSLEGMVFIGNIPIVRIRHAQFMTTAFKMNERTFPIEESSVTSDRYYDTPDLKFDFLTRDSLHANQFYYRLSPEGAVVLRPQYYSGRIAVPVDYKGDKIEALKTCLRKIVAAHKEENEMDNLIYFAGDSYNSDCMTAWLHQQEAFREYFPEAYLRSNTNKFLNFRQNPHMKFNLFNELQRDETDLFFISEHGLPYAQVVNGNYPARDRNESISELKRLLRNDFKSRFKGTAKEDEFIKEVTEEFHLSPDVFSDAELAKYQASDSAAKADVYILLEDIAKLKTNPRVLVLNSCYNGSFHNDGYVAAYHLFNGGKTVSVFGNSVNVLQDKWGDQLLGYWSLGMRAGEWLKAVASLEFNLIGDPTFRFKSSVSFQTTQNDTIFLKSLLSHSDPRFRAFAVKRLGLLYSPDNNEFSAKLLSLYRTEPSWTVRMQILEALSLFKDDNFTEVVRISFSDPYELVRRRGATWACKIGDPELITPLINAILFHPETQRVQYAAESSLQVFDQQKVREEYIRQRASTASQNDHDAFLTSLEKTEKTIKNNLATIADKTAKFTARESAIRYMRNYPLHDHTELFLRILNDTDEDESIRLLIAEALGWFDYSCNRKAIADSIAVALQSNLYPQSIKNEATLTLKRCQ